MLPAVPLAVASVLFSSFEFDPGFLGVAKTRGNERGSSYRGGFVSGGFRFLRHDHGDIIHPVPVAVFCSLVVRPP